MKPQMLPVLPEDAETETAALPVVNAPRAIEKPDDNYAIGERVVKFTGDYTGPGIVRDVTYLPNGKTRYLVGHKIEGGSGEFLHIYSEANLRRE